MRPAAAWSSGASPRAWCSALLIVLARPLFVPLFTSDPAVQDTLHARPCWWSRCPSRSPAIVFVLDGVLMGAGDGRYLAWAMLLTLAVFAPVALLVPDARRRADRAVVGDDADDDGPHGDALAAHPLGPWIVTGATALTTGFT